MSKSFREAKISRTTARVRALKRLVWWHAFSNRLPLYLITEFPKSGGTWYAKMLSQLIDVPFPPAFDSPTYQSIILRDTKLYSPRFKNISVVMRDGRDIMVSAYYHYLFYNEANMPYAVESNRKLLNFEDFDDIKANLPVFIEYMFEVFPRNGWGTRFSWAEFVDSWIDKDVPTVKYEKLLSDPINSLNRMVTKLTGNLIEEEQIQKVVEQYSFQSLTGRSAGDVKINSFARKGIAGDWKNNFDSKSCELFRQYAGKQLIDLGYEQDDAWVKVTKEKIIT